MPGSSQKFWNSAAVKFVSLSVMMLCGTPNLKIIDLMKLTAVRAVELVMGTTSIHLVNLSTTTSRCVLPTFDDFLSGPTMSSPQVANGQDSGMVLSSEAGACGLLANFWQATQRRMISSAFSWLWASRIQLGMLWTRALDCSCGARRCLRGFLATGLCRPLRQCTFGVSV